MSFKEKYLIYKSPEIPEGSFKFSPSQFAGFINGPVHKWYREQVLGEEGFTYSTSTVIGTIVHGIAAAVALGEEVDKEGIESYINDFEINEDYEPDKVRACYPEMAEALVNDYVLNNNFLSVEESCLHDMNGGYFVGGTTDRLEGPESKKDTLIVDYKTYSSSTKPKKIPSYYKYQLLVYAAVLRANGHNVTRIRLVYVNRPIVGEISPKTGKQFKSYPSEVTELTENLTEEDFDFIEGMLNLAADSLEASKEHPELVHVIFHDPRLKEIK